MTRPVGKIADVATSLDYDQIAADALAELVRAQAEAEACDARARGAQEAAAHSHARVAEAAAMREFVARHPGLSAGDLIAAADAELRELNADILQAQAEVVAAQAVAAEAAERVRDLQGYIRVAQSLTS